MIRKVYIFLKKNGIIETIKKIFLKIFYILGLKKSQNYILINDFATSLNFDYNDKYIITDDFNYKQYNNMKYYEFIKTSKWLDNNSKLIVAKDKEKIIAYGWMHFNKNHYLHNQFYFKLNKKEAWIGPIYVLPDYRGEAISLDLLKYSIDYLEKMDFTSVFTLININNIPSIINFCKVGFKVIGKYESRHIFSKLILKKIIDFKYNNTTFKEKVSFYNED